MKIEKSWTDIIFENRNKDYGGYVLRKLYDEVVLFSLAISIFLFVIVCGTVFLFGAYDVINYDTSTVTYDMSEIPIIDNPNMPDYLKSPPPAKPKEKPKQNSAPIVSVDTTQFDSLHAKSLPEDSLLAKKNSEVSGTGNDTANVGTGLWVVQKIPSFPGGEVAMKKFIRENIKPPKAFIDAKMQGTVWVSFHVEKDGSITNITVVSGIGLGCDEEAVRVVKMMPKWSPYIRNKIAIPGTMKLPIKFM
jgi:periplasmic protein TonB